MENASSQQKEIVLDFHSNVPRLSSTSWKIGNRLSATPGANTTSCASVEMEESLERTNKNGWLWLMGYNAHMYIYIYI